MACCRSPVSSGMPITTFRFWIACPDAPFTRLSITAYRILASAAYRRHFKVLLSMSLASGHLSGSCIRMTLVLGLLTDPCPFKDLQLTIM